jgi:mannitol 2-dehydrogenase
VAPFTPLTCDNIQHNGDVLRDAVVALARLRDGVGEAVAGGERVHVRGRRHRGDPVDHGRREDDLGGGAQFVEDVAPYEFMKLRLLNGSHLAVSGLGRLAG